jgi:hypothetical protein
MNELRDDKQRFLFPHFSRTHARPRTVKGVELFPPPFELFPPPFPLCTCLSDNPRLSVGQPARVCRTTRAFAFVRCCIFIRFNCILTTSFTKKTDKMCKLRVFPHAAVW